MRIEPAIQVGRGRRVLFCFGLVVVAGLVAEVGARLCFLALDRRPFDAGEQRRRQQSLMRRARQVDVGPLAEVLHPYLGYVANPEVNGRHYYALPINELGFQGPLNPIQKRAPDRVIIGIFGGSLAMDAQVIGWPALRAALSRSSLLAGKELIAVGLGLQGYKQPQQLMLLNYLLVLGAEFDVVINLDGFNEVALPPADGLSRTQFSLFPRHWSRRVQQVDDPAARRLRDRLAVLEQWRGAWAALFLGRGLRQSVTCQLLWRAGNAWLSADLARSYDALRAIPLVAGRYVATGPRRGPAEGSELYRELADSWYRSSLQMDRLCRANRIRYFHFLQPNQYLPGGKTLSAPERRDAYAPDHPYKPGAEQGYPLLMQRGRDLLRAGVVFADLTRVFQGVPETVYSDSCCHLNQRGHELLAQAMARVVLSRWSDFSDRPLARPAR